MADLDYADDISLIDDNIGDIPILLDALRIDAKSCGLKISVENTAFCCNQEDVILSCNCAQLNLVKLFTCLGSSIKLNGELAQEKKSRRDQPIQSYMNLDKFWCSKNIPRSLKIKIFNACFIIVLLYSCETWSLRT